MRNNIRVDNQYGKEFWVEAFEKTKIITLSIPQILDTTQIVAKVFISKEKYFGIGKTKKSIREIMKPVLQFAKTDLPINNRTTEAIVFDYYCIRKLVPNCTISLSNIINESIPVFDQMSFLNLLEIGLEKNTKAVEIRYDSHQDTLTSTSLITITWMFDNSRESLMIQVPWKQIKRFFKK